MSNSLPNTARPFQLVESIETSVENDINDASNISTQIGSKDEPCNICFGSGMEIVPGRGARQCECRKQRGRKSNQPRSETELAKLLEAAHIPSRYRKCTLANYQPAVGNASQLRALGYAYCIVREYPAIDCGLLLMGTVGVGKTHLAASVLRGLIEKGIDCLFYEFGALLKEIQLSFSKQGDATEREVLNAVYETDVLVLDELGAIKPTDWTKDMMGQIIGTRYNNEKLTIFTTNYMDERRHPAEETLEDRIGVRLRSRLYEMCRPVIIEGEDFRRKKLAAT